MISLSHALPTTGAMSRFLRNRDRDLAHLRDATSRSTPNSVIDDKNENRPADGDQHAVEIETRDAFAAELVHNPAADDRPNNAEDDVEDNAFAPVIDDLAGDETSDEAQRRLSRT
jgi:hypothetical protein